MPTTSADAVRILPMQTTGTQNFIERTYREGGTFQWVRETLQNALEAHATRVDFGIEWQAVENLGVYRRVIADDGDGMTATQLQEFFNTFGGGGKPIGGVHENFGVGAKTTLLPWNRFGVVVISWVHGDASMIRMQRNPETGEYGLRLEEATDENWEVSLEGVYEPWEDIESGCDWSALKPDWIKDHGTVLVLLGNGPSDDTVLGDPTRSEDDIKGISAYLNRRYWEIPPGVEVHVDELRTQERGDWPRNEAMAHGSQKGAVDRRTNTRAIMGARYYIAYPNHKAGRLAHQGTETLRDRTEVDWYLWEGDRPAVQSYAAISGYIAALYSGELYDVVSHHSTYRAFGVSEAAVRGRLWLVIRPPVTSDESKHGVYPRTDRNSLLLKGGPNAGGPLPIVEWGNEFAANMPEPIHGAIRAARAGEDGTIEDTHWRERLAERFGSRWRILKRRLNPAGESTVATAQGGTDGEERRIRRKKRVTGNHGRGGRRGDANLGSEPGTSPASLSKVAGGIPRYRLVRASEVGDGMLAAWHPNDPEFREGAVLVNVDHPVLEAEVSHWQSQFAEIYADQIAHDVLTTYGEIAVSKIAHSEHLRGIIPSKVVDDDVRSEAALTLALLGLIAEEAVLAPRLGGKYGKRART